MTLIHPHERKALAAQIKADIDEYCRVTYNEGPRSHLGASMIGQECSRFLWYSFRWAVSPNFSGRMQRLFNRGHKEELRFVEWLRGIGCLVSEFEDAAGEKQWRITGVGGHFGGSLDGRMILPQRYNIADEMLLEMKTHKTGPTWQKLVENGVKVEQPTYWAQMCSYGRKYGIRYALYISINKDDDDLHIEIVELDFTHGEVMEGKAADVIMARNPPPRINESPAFFKCKVCDARDVCHKGAAYNRNCRSCAHAVPVEGAQWFCEHWGSVIPTKEAILAGCGDWHPAGRQ